MDESSLSIGRVKEHIITITHSPYHLGKFIPAGLHKVIYATHVFYLFDNDGMWRFARRGVIMFTFRLSLSSSGNIRDMNNAPAMYLNHGNPI